MEFDLIIKNGSVIDGTGAPARSSDVGITGDRIEAIDNLEAAQAAETIDASGRVVSPGFVDVHIHSETNLLDPNNPYRHAALLQGVTTHLAGPDGFGWAGLSPELASELWESTVFAYGKTDLKLNWPKPEDYLALFTGNSPANLMPQAPHCAIRLGVMGWAARDLITSQAPFRIRASSSNSRKSPACTTGSMRRISATTSLAGMTPGKKRSKLAARQAFPFTSHTRTSARSPDH